jgi:hypothetical protein
MTPERRQQMFAEPGEHAADEWVFAARDAQLPPADLGWAWLLERPAFGVYAYPAFRM